MKSGRDACRNNSRAEREDQDEDKEQVDRGARIEIRGLGRYRTDNAVVVTERAARVMVERHDDREQRQEVDAKRQAEP